MRSINQSRRERREHKLHESSSNFALAGEVFEGQPTDARVLLKDRSDDFFLFSSDKSLKSQIFKQNENIIRKIITMLSLPTKVVKVIRSTASTLPRSPSNFFSSFREISESMSMKSAEGLRQHDVRERISEHQVHVEFRAIFSALSANSLVLKVSLECQPHYLKV